LYPLLVTGAGGSGTNLAGSALRAHEGISIGHEHIEVMRTIVVFVTRIPFVCLIHSHAPVNSLPLPPPRARRL
jgi:hypothetical protein